MKMNEKQANAISDDSRSVFLLSGAGTGKTRVITAKIQHIHTQNEYKPTFLILSFTKRSIFELKSRLKNLGDNVFITTFHGLAYHIVKPEIGNGIFDSKYRSLLDMSDDSLLMIASEKRLMKKNDVTTKTFKDYSAFLHKNQLIDYLDLEILALKKMKNIRHNELNDFKYDYIFIDEFQDTSDIQFMLLKLLSRHDTKIFAVGDPDQSIYSFRGTGEKVIESFIDAFGAKKLLLDLNYRCSRQILFHANNLISYNKHQYRKKLAGVKIDEGIVKSFLVHSKSTEASLVLLNIKECLKRGYQQSDIGVLFRNHKDAQFIKYAFYNSYLTDVHLLSMHQSKGLEFKIVIIIGLRKYHYESKKNLEEERRLFFVSITRAMDELYIYMPVDKANISRFIKEGKIKYETLD